MRFLIKVFLIFYCIFQRQEVLAEDETEDIYGSHSDSDDKVERKISFEKQNGIISRDSRKTSEVTIDSKLPSRKTSAMNSAASSAGPSRRWSRHSSPTRGEILRMDDEVACFFKLYIFLQSFFFR